MKPSLVKPFLCIAIIFCCAAFIKKPAMQGLASPKDSTIFNCNLDLRASVFSIDSQMNVNYAKHNPAFSDVEYFADCNGFVSTYCKADTSLLFYNVYYPKNHNYNSSKLPAVIVFHSGAFSDCSPLDSTTESNKICREFAKRGFVAFNVSYRTGTMIDFIDRKYISSQQVLAVYRAVQDARGSVRSIIKRETKRKQFNDPYSFDTSNIFLAGQSAGSSIVLNLAYYQTQAMIDSASSGAGAVLGSINADYYYGDSTIQYQKKIKGVMNMWGNVFLPLSTLPHPTDFFAANINNPPLISFHGLLDSIAPYGITDIYYAPNNFLHSTFNSETHCLVSGNRYRLYPKTPGPDMYASGSYNIYNFLKQKKIPAELYLDCQMGHGLDDTKDPLLFKSDFGTGITRHDSVNVYMVQRASVFFQAVVNNIAKDLGTSKFTECENKRFGCSTKNDNNGCSNKDSCLPAQPFTHFTIAAK